MKFPFNHLSIIALGVFVISCGSQQVVQTPTPPPIKNNNTKTQPVATTPPVAPPKSNLQHLHGEDFYRINISDPTKNDNTISYGSIVSAKPLGYQITKDYFPAVAQNFRQRYLILHYTAIDDEKSIKVLTQQTVSAHYLVNDLDDNEIYQLVDENKRAYHAGVSQWRGDANLNDTSIGIEIVNLGFSTDASGNRTFYAYPEFQYKKIASLVKDIVSRYSIPPTNLLGHSDIAPTRKQDPGPLFPWKRLYDEYQLGMWYDEATKQNFYNTALALDYTTQMADTAFVYQMQIKLKQLGYGIELTGTYDDATKKTVEAFQAHFRPTNYSGMIDAETWSILQALVQKYPSKQTI